MELIQPVPWAAIWWTLCSSQSHCMVPSSGKFITLGISYEWHTCSPILQWTSMTYITIIPWNFDWLFSKQSFTLHVEYSIPHFQLPTRIELKIQCVANFFFSIDEFQGFWKWDETLPWVFDMPEKSMLIYIWYPNAVTVIISDAFFTWFKLASSQIKWLSVV